MASETEDKKTLIDSACRTAKDFINIYYEKIDKNRNALAKLYLDKQGGGNGATLSWNGNRIDGPEEIQKFFIDRVPQTSHNIMSYDAQPVLGEFVNGQRTVAVHVGGSVKFANDNRPKPFQQNFLLTAQGSHWKVATDVFRYQERA